MTNSIFNRAQWPTEPRLQVGQTWIWVNGPNVPHWEIVGTGAIVDNDSGFVAHARRELTLLGEDPDVIEKMITVVRAYADMADSGGAHTILVERLYELLHYRTLTPLTDDPAEWIDRTDVSGFPVWQSLRNPAAFSENGGETYYFVGAGAPHRREYFYTMKKDETVPRSPSIAEEYEESVHTGYDVATGDPMPPEEIDHGSNQGS